MKNLAVNLAWAFAGAFVIAAVMGFVPNPLVGENALFVTNTPHNLVHLATAIGFVVVALLGEQGNRFQDGATGVGLVAGAGKTGGSPGLHHQAPVGLLVEAYPHHVYFALQTKLAGGK